MSAFRVVVEGFGFFFFLSNVLSLVAKCVVCVEDKRLMTLLPSLLVWKRMRSQRHPFTTYFFSFPRWLRGEKLCYCPFLQPRVTIAKNYRLLSWGSLGALEPKKTLLVYYL